jgi:hypothetical protein
MRGDRGATVEVASEAGLIKIQTTALNQDDKAVLEHVVNLVVLRRENVLIG